MKRQNRVKSAKEKRLGKKATNKKKRREWYTLQ